ncbi:hypothetical protein [Streptomyces sp. NPDC094032]|uniref:hypothetical protein n=1 Tax=Streptomyces sp. NPDC094032 TaxID=3155308 RepID=UPI003326E300
MKPMGGGATVEDDPVGAVLLRETAPEADRNRWRVRAYNSSTTQVSTLHPRVICSTDTTLAYVSGLDAPLRPGESNRSSTALCGSQFVVGGGFQAGDSTFVGQTDLAGIRAWSARANYRNFDPNAPLSFVRALAVCSDVQPAVNSSDTVNLAAGAVGTAHVECPQGKVPTGGGGTGGLDVLLNTSNMTETGWTVQAINTAPGPRTLVATVLCTAP